MVNKAEWDEKTPVKPLAGSINLELTAADRFSRSDLKEERIRLAESSLQMTDSGLLPGLEVKSGEGVYAQARHAEQRLRPNPWDKPPMSGPAVKRPEPRKEPSDQEKAKEAESASKARRIKEGAQLRPEELPPISPERRSAFERDYKSLSLRIQSGELKADAKKILPIHANGGEVWDWDKLSWAIARPAEAKIGKITDSNVRFDGPSTVSAAAFNAKLKNEGSVYADAKEPVKVRLPDGTIGTVSLDMGQLAKLYELKWQEQGHISINAAALLSQSQHEINLANLSKLSNAFQGEAAVQRTLDTNQWAGIKWKKGTFRCEADEKNWEKLVPAKLAEKLKAAGIWSDKKETRVWSSPGKSMCGWFEHIGEKYLANGKKTASEIIPTYVGTNAGPHYISGFARVMRELGK